jgi:Tfp pilus assembly protein PilX
MSPHASLRRTLPSRAAQRGATLIIRLIMIVLITLIVVNAFTLSSSNLKEVGNMQLRQEGIAAANQAVETVVSSAFYDSASNYNIAVDIDKDGTTDYTVAVAQPVCVAAKQVSVAAPSDVELPVAMQSGAEWNTDWDLSATVTDAKSGASVVVREGVRVRLSQTKKTTDCP